MTDTSAEFGIAIGESDQWGRGIGTAAGELLLRHAFDDLGLQRIDAEVPDANARSLRLVQRLGFRLAIFPGGTVRALAHTLAAYYASLGGARPADSSLAAALEAFTAEHEGALRETLATQRTQTNEIGRSAVLWPALAEISHRHGGRPLALFDFGCSAGLNLQVDACRIRYQGADGVLRFGAV